MRGFRLVWVIDPENHAVFVHRPDGGMGVIGDHMTLSGEDVLPGFSVTLGDIFA